MRKTWALLAVAMLAGACTSASVHTNVAPGANLGRYRTFAWYRGPEQGPLTPADQAIQSAILRGLEAKGFEPAPAGQSDFLVAYHVVERQRVEASGPAFWGPYGPWGPWGPWGSWGYWGPADYVTYTQGTVVVDFIDPRTDRVFWRGTATQVVDHPENPDPGRIYRGVAKVIRRYPYTVVAGAPTPAG